MAIFKCKMCGGTIEFNQGDTVGVCDSCGTKQTLPKLDDEKRIQLYDRANYFRRENEFDKAMGIYEMIIADEKEDAEAYWGIVLCKYGIEYVEDPRTHKRIPTVNRAQYTSVFDDKDYQSAIKYADGYQRDVIEAEAKQIDAIQKGILEISNKEEPFDVFICYKETDASGSRTQDSVYAQDIYKALTDEGYKVFFSRITLEAKLGQQYEPYIFAALNSAKVMLAIGTSKENFEAVWVKNEWSRFLALTKTDKSKVLIPCYKDISPYDMPEEFTYLQSQDMGKIGFIQDLLHGISKVVKRTAPKETVVFNSGNTEVEPLLKRAFMFLEDGDWDNANQYCERVLDIDPENAMAYLGKLMADLKLNRQEQLGEYLDGYEDNQNYQKTRRYADGKLNTHLDEYLEKIKNTKLENAYKKALTLLSTVASEKEYLSIKNRFIALGDYKDSVALIKQCEEKAEFARKDHIYKVACELMEKNSVSDYEKAISEFNSILGWKDTDDRLDNCKQKLKVLIEKQEQLDAEEKKRQQKQIEKKNHKRKITISVGVIAVFCVLVFVFVNALILPMVNYNKAVRYENDGKIDSAYELFVKAGSFKDAYQKSEALFSSKIHNTTNYVLAGGTWHSVGVKKDGTVISCGDNGEGQCDVDNWKNVISVSANTDHTIGLKSDGTVYATGNNSFGQCNVSEWKDIVAVSTGPNFSVGVKKDGTVVSAVKKNNLFMCDTAEWKDIVAISANGDHTVGVHSDGTAIASGSNGCNVSNWKNIVAVAVGGTHTVGLKSNGTVVATGTNGHKECNVSEWNNIIAITAGDGFTIGLKSDGTVVATGNNEHGQCNVSEWSDIVAISAGASHTIGLKSDGTVVGVGANGHKQRSVNDWKNISTK